MSDLEDVMGFEVDKPKKDKTPGLAKFDYSLLDGVTTSWLSSAFGMDRRTVRKKLRNVECVKGPNNSDLYDFKEACGHLIDPLYNIEDFIKGMRSSDLPVSLQKDFWEAQNKKQTYLKNAGELWHTDDVVEVFSQGLSMIKEVTSLWAMNIEDKSFLTKEQYNLLTEQINHLQIAMIEEMENLAKKSVTKSSLVEREYDEEVLGD